MKLNKKALAILAGLTVGMSTTAFAATADSFTDVPKDHWSYEALDYLAKEGVIEGMGDNTFQGGRAMTRYEVASIVAKAMQKNDLNFGDKTVLDKLAAEYAGEINTLKKQVDQNTKDINDLKNSAAGKLSINGFIRTQYDHDENTTKDTLDKGTNRFYMNINGAFKVNDNWSAHFQSETNRHYNDGHHRNQETGFSPANGSKTWSGHDGNMQRIWAEGYFPNSKSWVSIGRAWRGLGFQNVLFGNESDGIQFGTPIPGTHLTGSGFWMASTGEGNKESIYGVATWGSIGHAVDINLAYGKSSLDKGEVYSSGNTYLKTDMNPTLKDKDGKEVPNPDYGKVTTATTPNDVTNKRSYGWVASTGINLAKNLRFLADYSRTDADFQNDSLALRLNYRNTDLNNPGTYQLYTRYIKYGENGWLAGDDEWNSIWNGTKGWIFGVKYVPAKNIEWETLYSPQVRGWSQDWQYDRKLFRTQVDYHF
ncbi:S-layer homology domain-containing protein [Mitsuokella sp.]|uniref:S-layer homology domain-containing protein n=1 Tax=Mitsuokella sp. TaxID=2049034 RepID=UPI002A83BDE9|nr:S-layer homology domain-containing protein [Mitsuokella sp.]MDY4474216.1 S-layer homology domain-containing protein [Mitsuokella sp.]